MSQIYRTKDGDMLDAICYERYGSTDGTVEAVLSSNPGLAERGPVYDAGVDIELPDAVSSATTKTTFALWA
jgi:phage tail protein X